MCGESESERHPGVSTTPFMCVLVWIVIAVVNKYISRRQKNKMLAIRTKRSTSCIVYYCSIVKNKA